MSSPTCEILLAEDDESDVQLMRRAFRDAGVSHSLRVVPDGQAAIDYLRELEDTKPDRAPALILLDLKMPRRDGMEVLQWIKSHLTLKVLPVFMFSSSGLSRDVEPAYACGASIYIVKPPSTAERADVVRFMDHWLRLGEPSLAVTAGFGKAAVFHTAWAKSRGKN